MTNNERRLRQAMNDILVLVAKRVGPQTNYLESLVLRTDEIRAKALEALRGESSMKVELISHMDLPDGVQWSKNGWYIKLLDGQYRWVCGLNEIPDAHLEGLSEAIRQNPNAQGN